jgi:hypothetical protein
MITPSLKKYTTSLFARARSTTLLMSEERGVLVESGTFKIDRRRALKKLAKFQLESPNLFLLPWIRFAVAGGARKISLQRKSRGVELVFDGRALSEKALRQPYSALFEEAVDARRKYLALAVLGSVHIGTVSLTASTPSGKRLTLVAQGPLKESCQEVRGGSKRFHVLLIPERGKDVVWAGLARLRDSFGYAACTLSIDGRRVLPALPLGHNFSRDIVRGRLQRDDDPESKISRIAIYVHGVRVCRSKIKTPWVEVTGVVVDDRLTLNASQSGVAHNEEFGRMAAILNAGVRDFLASEVAAYERRSAQLATLFRRNPSATAFRALWKKRVADASKAGVSERVLNALMAFPLRIFKSARKASTAQRLIDLDARRVRWLRRACNSLQSYHGDRKRKHHRMLWRAPLFFSTGGHPRSLRDADRIRKESGRLLISKRWAPGAYRFMTDVGLQIPRWARAQDVFWVPAERDRRLLRKFFKNQVEVVK